MPMFSPNLNWASLVVQRLKCLPAMWETWVWSLGWEDYLEKEMATHSQYSCLENPMDRGVWWATVHEVTKNQTWLSDFNFTYTFTLFIKASVLTSLTGFLRLTPLIQKYFFLKSHCCRLCMKVSILLCTYNHLVFLGTYSTLKIFFKTESNFPLFFST